MTPDHKRQLKAYRTAFLRVHAVFEAHANRVSPHVVDESVVDQLTTEMLLFAHDFPSLAPPFSKQTFFAHDVGRGAYYKLPALQTALAFVIGQIEAAADDDALTTEGGIEHDMDAVTGVRKREAMDAALPAELSEAVSRGNPFALIMVDVDKFKSVNDKHGHPKGDEVLRAVAGCLNAVVTGKGAVYRARNNIPARVRVCCAAAFESTTMRCGLSRVR